MWWRLRLVLTISRPAGIGSALGSSGRGAAGSRTRAWQGVIGGTDSILLDSARFHSGRDSVARLGDSSALCLAVHAAWLELDPWVRGSKVPRGDAQPRHPHLPPREAVVNCGLKSLVERPKAEVRVTEGTHRPLHLVARRRLSASTGGSSAARLQAGDVATARRPARQPNRVTPPGRWPALVPAAPLGHAAPRRKKRNHHRSTANSQSSCVGCEGDTDFAQPP